MPSRSTNIVCIVLFTAGIAVSFSVSQRAILFAAPPRPEGDQFTTVWYPVADLATVRPVNDREAHKTIENTTEPIFDATLLIGLIKCRVAPDSWHRDGASIKVDPSAHRLEIRQTQRVHEELLDLLTELRERVESNVNRAADQVSAVRSMYGRIPPDLLAVREPIQIIHADVLSDGSPGTFFVKFRDADNRVVCVCLDGRFPPDANKAYTDTHVYLGAVERDAEGARRIPIRGPEEAVLYGILIRWAAGSTEAHSSGARKSLERHSGEMTRRFLRELDRRFSALPSEAEPY